MSASVTERGRGGRTSTIPNPRESTGRGTRTGATHGAATRTATRTSTGTATRTATRAEARAAVRTPESRRAHTVTQRAYARRDERLRRSAGAPAPVVRTAASTGRAKFVLLIMVLLVGGLVATLWLSTAAAADSYELRDARADAVALTQQSEALRREVTHLQSAPELARRAGELGMVRVQDPARLVVGPDGAVTVVGEPEAARLPAPPPPPPGSVQPGTVQPGVDPAVPPVTPEGTAVDGAVPDGAVPDGTVPPAAGQPATPPATGQDGAPQTGQADAAGTAGAGTGGTAEGTD